MKNQNRMQAKPAVFKSPVMALLGLFMLVASGCAERDAGDGIAINQIILPTDTLLNLACADAGIWRETCVLSDPENPYAGVITAEFNPNNEDGPSKFDLNAEIPAGETGAKARFYLWATALARFPSGENQWYTARALHELYNYNSDPLIQEQALKAYRSNLDNFFGSVTFFECCGGVSFSVTLNEQVADDLYRTDSTGWVRLIPGDPLNAQSLIAEWGYTYRPATPPDFNDGLVFVSQF